MLEKKFLYNNQKEFQYYLLKKLLDDFRKNYLQSCALIIDAAATDGKFLTLKGGTLQVTPEGIPEGLLKNYRKILEEFLVE